MDMNFCRRCGSKLTNQHDHVYKCEQGHVIYANASPAVALWFVNSNDEVLLITRGINPGKGFMDAPGGFCDGAELLEDAARREAEEEVGIKSEHYGALEFICTDIDRYDLDGETLPVLSAVFVARLQDGAVPEAADDAAEVMFMRPEDVDASQIYFPTVRKSFELLRDNWQTYIDKLA